MADDILFSVLNQDGQQSLVAGEANQLTLTITNNTAGPLALTGGPPVPEAQASSGPSSLYLSFGDLLTAELQKAITISVSGWTPRFFDGPGGGWALACDVSHPWPAGQPQIVVIFGNVHVPAGARPAQVTIDYYNLGTVTDSSGIDLPVRKKPSGLGVPSLSPSWVEATPVVITTDPAHPVANSLTFTITNGSQTKPIVPADVKWGDQPPVFQVGFVCAKRPGYGALTTNERAADIGLEQAQVYRDVWKPVQNRQASPPYWDLVPQNHEVLGVGDAASVQFTLSNIVTELEPGITVLYLQYANLPGYDDGDIVPALTIEKRLPAKIVSFTASPRVVDFSGGSGVSVTLSWHVEHAQVVSISEVGEVDRGAAPQTFTGSCLVTVRQRTTYVLQASPTRSAGEGPTTNVEVLPISEYLPGNSVPVVARRQFDIEFDEEKDTYTCYVNGSVSFTATNANCSLSLSGTKQPFYLDNEGAWEPGSVSPLSPNAAVRSGSWSLSGSIVTLNSPDGNLQFRFSESQGQPVLTLLTSVFIVEGQIVPYYGG